MTKEIEFEREIVEVEVDTTSLYKIEKITDLKFTNITMLTPIKPDGKKDSNRKVKYIGNSSFETPYGVIPVHVELKSTTLNKALKEYPDAIKTKIDDLIEAANERMKELEEAKSSELISGKKTELQLV
jgi:hypothetical protein